MSKPIILPLGLCFTIVIALFSLAFLLGVTFTRPIEYVGIVFPSLFFLFRQIRLRRRYDIKK